MLKQYNSKQVACRLPEAVLRNIFFECVHLSIGSHDSECNSWSWVGISQVCSFWRTVAHSCAQLWRFIDFSHPWSWALTFERAKMSPLHLDAFVKEHNTRLVQRTLQLAHRIQDIHIRASLQDIYPFLELLTHPNPAVESLIVEVDIPKSRPFGKVYDRPLFPTCGPPLEDLKYMELHSAPFYFLTPRCTHLTQFHLHDLPLTERPILRSFLFMLELLQDLEHLTIDRSFPINLELVEAGFLERCTLPKLKTISLVGSTIEVANILECLSFPPSVRLSIKIWTLSDSRNNAWKLSQWISSRGHGEGVQRVEKIILTGRETGTRFMADSLDLNPDYRQSLRIQTLNSRGHVMFDVAFEPYEHIADDELLVFLLTLILKGLPLADIHTLSVRDLDFVTQKSWTQLLRSMSYLRVLDIAGRAPSGLAWALLLNARLHNPECMVPDGSWNHGLLIPRLNDIYLRDVDCSSGGYMLSRTAAINSYSDLDDSRFLDVINASLCERRELGLYLRSMSINQCEFVLKKSVDDARTVVAHLVCDVRRLLKDDDVDETRPARYRNTWNFDHPLIAHYHRLHALAMDSDF